jgi:hypothetical protein
VNPRTRRAALYAIGAIAILASINALTHSYAGLYDWAIHHRLTGWQAMSWPAEIDVFLAIGELSLYVAYLDGWSARHRVWPWVTALIGLSVSVAGNIGHIQPQPGHPVILADRLTAATSPLAAFAGLSIGLLVLKMTREHQYRDNDQALSGPPERTGQPEPAGQLRLVPARQTPADQAATTAAAAAGPGWLPAPPNAASAGGAGAAAETDRAAGDRQGLMRDASLIRQAATASGERLSQRALARELRSRGHRFSNEHLHDIASSIGLAAGQAA